MVKSTELAVNTQRDRAYHGLLYGLFRNRRQNPQQGLVVALTSANVGEGVSHVARALMSTIEEYSDSDGFLAHMSLLKESTRATNPEHSITRDEQWTKTVGVRERIQFLRSRYREVIVDCPSIATNGDLMSIAPLVDGILLIVEANRTRKEEIRHAERQILGAGGNLLGLVLNKRRYEVPNWLYRRL